MTRYRYVERGGTQNIPNPFALRDVKMQAWFFHADRARLSTLCDKTFNEPLRALEAPGLFRFRTRIVPLAPLVMLVCANTARIEVAERGFMPEVDVAFWFPVVVMRGLLAPYVAFYQPYLFVDSGEAVATGRETYGYHKMLGQFVLPTDLRQPERLRVDTMAWERFGAGERAAPRRILELKRVAQEPARSQRRASLRDVLAHIQERASEAASSLGDVHKLLETLTPLKEVRQVFLKQFRSIEDPRFADFQAITEASARLSVVHAAGLLDGQFELEVDDLASHPIRDELGLAQGVLRPFAQLYAHIDFELREGRTIARSEAVCRKKR